MSTGIDCSILSKYLLLSLCPLSISPNSSGIWQQLTAVLEITFKDDMLKTYAPTLFELSPLTPTSPNPLLFLPFILLIPGSLSMSSSTASTYCQLQAMSCVLQLWHWWWQWQHGWCHHRPIFPHTWPTCHHHSYRLPTLWPTSLTGIGFVRFSVPHVQGRSSTQPLISHEPYSYILNPSTTKLHSSTISGFSYLSSSMHCPILLLSSTILSWDMHTAHPKFPILIIEWCLFHICPFHWIRPSQP